jgi:bifunctional non-homologous end joining protein LigD
LLISLNQPRPKPAPLLVSASGIIVTDQNELIRPEGVPVMKAKKSLRFVVHEHRASRLHYDFRLEIGGVLKSWAVPKGPSMNPADKRLAVMVPDHVLEYFDFEGIIPEGEHGAGPVVIWDTGEFSLLDSDDPEESLVRGRLSFTLQGKKLRGAFALARMKGLPKGTGKEWLLMKKNDEFVDPGFTVKTELTPGKIETLRKRMPPCKTE